jgi:hypothetical protein
LLRLDLPPLFARLDLPPLFPRLDFFALDFLPRMPPDFDLPRADEAGRADFLPPFLAARFVPPDLPRVFELEAAFFRPFDAAFAAVLADLLALVATRLTAFFTLAAPAGEAALLPTAAPMTPPTTAPTGPMTLPITAPVAAPAASFEIGGISMFSEDELDC